MTVLPTHSDPQIKSIIEQSYATEKERLEFQQTGSDTVPADTNAQNATNEPDDTATDTADTQDLIDIPEPDLDLDFTDTDMALSSDLDPLITQPMLDVFDILTHIAILSLSVIFFVLMFRILHIHKNKGR